MITLKQYPIALRFLIAGGFNSLFGWLSYSIAILMAAPPWLALIIGLGMGICFNFITLGGYVFRDMTIKRVPMFVLAYCFIYTINLLCLTGLTYWSDQPIWNQLFLTPPMAVLSYMLMSRMVFTKTSSDEKNPNSSSCC